MFKIGQIIEEGLMFNGISLQLCLVFIYFWMVIVLYVYFLLIKVFLPSQMKIVIPLFDL